MYTEERVKLSSKTLNSVLLTLAGPEEIRQILPRDPVALPASEILGQRNVKIS